MKATKSLGALSLPAVIATLLAVVLVNSSSAQPSLAPVVDADQSQQWFDEMNEAESTRDESSNNCRGGCSGACQGGHGGGPCTCHDGGCNYGTPLWTNACQTNGCGPGAGIGMFPMPGMFNAAYAPMGPGGCSPGYAATSGCSGQIGGCGGSGAGGCYSMGGDCQSMICPCEACSGQRRCRVDFFGEFLYLRSRNAEVAYAVPIDGPITPVLGNGIQIGPTGIAEMNHQGGFRVGTSIFGQNCNGLMAQWTHFNSSDDDSINIAPPDVIRSVVTHPLGTNAASDGLQADAQYDIDFHMVDLTFRLPWKKCNSWCAEVLWGLRYANLNQEFLSTINFNGTTSVTTDIDFNGIGPQVGLMAQRRLGHGCLFAYSQGLASFLVGRFDAHYVQNNSFAGVLVDSSWDSGRIVPQLEYELGIGIMSPNGRVRVRAGYMVSAWFNAVRTNEFINAVQSNDPDGLGDGITFDGLTLRTEVRF